VPEQRVAMNLALAYLIERSIEKGLLDDYSSAAKVLGLTRARVTQVVSLLNLSPQIQEGILTGQLKTSGRQLRPVLRHATWTTQREEVSR